MPVASSVTATVRNIPPGAETMLLLLLPADAAPILDLVTV
jgi:hypothetical protein